MSSDSFKNVIDKLCVYKAYNNMYKEDLVLNNLQGLICHKTQLNQIIIFVCNHNPAKITVDICPISFFLSFA